MALSDMCHRFLLVITLVMVPFAARADTPSLLEAIREIDANVVFMRHALAPGFGDPEGFRLDACESQRNLDETGRQQAVETGRKLRTLGVTFDRILSSEWCRCWQTAELLDVGEYQTFPGLNSFFQGHADRDETLALLRAELTGIGSDLTLMVTHQVVIQAVARRSAPSGGIVVYNTRSGKSLPASLD